MAKPNRTATTSSTPTHTPVYIISHARAGRLSPELQALNPTLVVAAAEQASYESATPDLTVSAHPQTGAGVAHARNQALTLARKAGHGALWLLDDDLYAFWRQDPRGRWCEDAATALAEAEAQAAAHPSRPALVGLLPAYGKPHPDADLTPALDQELYQCVRLDLERLDPIRYDETLALSEDNDLCLQAITRGFHTYRPRHLGYLSPLPGTSPGGLSTTYTDTDSAPRTVNRMLAKWPAYCTPTRAGHRVDTHWHRIPGSLAPAPEPHRRTAGVSGGFSMPACAAG